MITWFEFQRMSLYGLSSHHWSAHTLAEWTHLAPQDYPLLRLATICAGNSIPFTSFPKVTLWGDGQNNQDSNPVGANDATRLPGEHPPLAQVTWTAWCSTGSKKSSRSRMLGSHSICKIWFASSWSSTTVMWADSIKLSRMQIIQTRCRDTGIPKDLGSNVKDSIPHIDWLHITACRQWETCYIDSIWPNQSAVVKQTNSCKLLE